MNNFVKIAWWGKHFGEEPPLVGNEDQGAGGVFFSGCNLHCVFCQNYQISQEGLGKEYSIDELASIFLELQKQGAVNIDLVTPTIWWQQIKEAIILAKERGLNLPIVWNSNAYEKVEHLKEMEGLVDIYLPDYKYSDDSLAEKYSLISNYSNLAVEAITEMYRQIGNLRIENGLAKRGIIIRHLVLPGNIENSISVLESIARIDSDIFVSLMNQFNPLFKANDFPEINKTLAKEEFAKVEQCLFDLNLLNGWVQEGESSVVFNPDFDKTNPF